MYLRIYERIYQAGGSLLSVSGDSGILCKGHYGIIRVKKDLKILVSNLYNGDRR